MCVSPRRRLGLAALLVSLVGAGLTTVAARALGTSTGAPEAGGSVLDGPVVEEEPGVSGGPQRRPPVEGAAREGSPEGGGRPMAGPAGRAQAAGRELAAELGCGACHEGAPDPGLIRSRAPRLLEGGPSLPVDFVFEYLGDPRPRRDDIGASRMPDFRLDEAERAALALHLGAGRPSGALARVLDDRPELDRELGERIWGALGCDGCHGDRSGAGPDLSREGARVRPDWLRSYLASPSPIRSDGHPGGPGSRMPDFRLDAREVEALAAWLTASGARVERGAPGPPTPARARRTERLVRERLACLGCHRIGEEGGAIGPSLDDLADRRRPAWVVEVIRDPAAAVPGSGMPRQVLPPGEVEAVAAWLLHREASAPSPPPRLSLADPAHPAHAVPGPGRAREEHDGPEAPASAGAALYARHCAACHGSEGRGDGWNLPYLPVPPTAHADPEAMALRPDDTLFDGIHAGARVLDGSPRMPAFGALLEPGEIRALVAHIRRLCDCVGPGWSRDGRRP